MNEKPTFASVTDVACTCGYLSRAADDPENPIEFDSETHEYQFKYPAPECGDHEYARAMLVIYHCPFCDGAAPKSRRDLLFAKISADEEGRLATLLGPIQTMADAIEKFGVPDFDGFTASHYPEDGDRAPTITHQREIRFHSLSKVADVSITEFPGGKVYWQLAGKYLGRTDER